MLDPRFGAIAAVVPTSLENERCCAALKSSVPDDAVTSRYIVLRGCEPHNCENKGFLWIDTATRQGIAMTGGSLASKTTAAAKIPPLFWKHTVDVVGQWADETVEFTDPSGKTAKLRVP